MTRREQITEAAQKYFDAYLNGLKGETLTVQQTFEDGAKWADKTMIDKACVYLNEELSQHEDRDGYPNVESRTYVCVEDFINDFKRAMEE